MRNKTKVTSIQKYSIHDGDGIRTTIFFKGCPLRCVWCHNPETQKYGSDVMYNQEKCVGCGTCLEACPQEAIVRVEEHVSTNLELCQRCGTCIEYCVNNLREISGIEYTVKELINEVMKDEMFYEESGGGVTLSGGEVMTMDMDYIEALVKGLYKKGISITIDTCGYAPYEHFQRILPYIDTFLYDLKAMDKEIHQKYMGVDNTLILENLKRLSADGARIYIRLPMIREVNASPESVAQVMTFLIENHIAVAQVNLLPYHNTGSGKYNRLGMDYEGMEFHPPSSIEMEQMLEQFQMGGFANTHIGG